VKALAPHLQSRLRALSSHPLVGEARGVGLIGALQLVADKATRRPLPPAEGIGPLVQQGAMARGVIVRAGPDAVFVCPPLIITTAQIDEMMDAVAAALDEAFAVAERRGLLGRAQSAAG
jgi:4-aminobutyrate---pyruvate transaminase